MISVVIAEDEPASAEYLSLLIQRNPYFHVDVMAANGEEALSKIKDIKPDLLVTDVKMPCMDGISLIEHAKGICPGLEAVVVSGFAEFEYAKGAIKNGALDYLLKPITPKKIKPILEKVSKIIFEKLSVLCFQTISDILNGCRINDEKLKKVFSYSRYYAVLIRENGLPKRFSLHNRQASIDSKNLVCIYGRDTMENLYIWPSELIKLDILIAQLKKKKRYNNSYLTTVIQPHSIEKSALPDTIRALYDALAKNLILGQNNDIYLDRIGSKSNYKKISGNYFSRIVISIQQQNLESLRTNIARMLAFCENEHYPQIYVEDIVTQLLIEISKFIPIQCTFQIQLEDAFYYATTYEELAVSVYDIIVDLSGIEGQRNIKINTPEFFSRIEQYLENNISQNYSLTDICNMYGVSQSYISKLFRKYTGKSYSEFIVTSKIQKAMEIMKNNPGILVKEVAAMVGYTDQFYFSRIFHSAIGESPTAFINKLT